MKKEKEFLKNGIRWNSKRIDKEAWVEKEDQKRRRVSQN